MLFAVLFEGFTCLLGVLVGLLSGGLVALGFPDVDLDLAEFRALGATGCLVLDVFLLDVALPFGEIMGGLDFLHLKVFDAVLHMLDELIDESVNVDF